MTFYVPGNVLGIPDMGIKQNRPKPLPSWSLHSGGRAENTEEHRGRVRKGHGPGEDQSQCGEDGLGGPA